MADIASDIKISLLFQLYDLVPATYATLLDGIKAKASEWNSAINGGAIASTSGNGHSVTFASGGLNSSEMAEFGGELRLTYEASRAALISSGIAAPTDAQILDEMVFRFVACTSFRKDYSTAREGAGL